MIAASYPAVMRLLLNNQAPLMQLFQHYAVRCAVECRCAFMQVLFIAMVLFSCVCSGG